MLGPDSRDVLAKQLDAGFRAKEGEGAAARHKLSNNANSPAKVNAKTEMGNLHAKSNAAREGMDCARGGAQVASIVSKEEEIRC